MLECMQHLLLHVMCKRFQKGFSKKVVREVSMICWL
jgi:hypothetical protein